MWPWVAGVILLIALFLAGRAVMGERRAASSQVRYAVGEVRRGPIQVFATGTGTVASADRQAIFAGVEGVVSAIPVKVGDRMKKDQVLIHLTNDDVTAAVDQARLQLEQARLRLRAEGAAAVASPLSGTVNVTAPAAGRIVGLRVKADDMVQQGTVLAGLADNRSVEFVIQVLEPERERIRPGQAAVVTVDDFEGQFPGHVVSVGEQAIAGEVSLLYEVRVTLENPGLLRDGMTGQMTIQAEGRDILRPGVVAWAASRSVTAPIAGRIEQVGVAEGQTVQAGQQIARIANETWPAEVGQLRLAVSQAELTLRSKEDLRDGLTIRAPADGVVVALNAKVGDRVAAGARTTGSETAGELAVVASGDAAVVTVAIDEMSVAKLEVGQEAEVTFPALPGKTFSGKVEQVAQEGKSENGVTTYDVQVRIDRPDGIRAGMTATASIRVDGKEDALLVPVEAVSDSPRGPVVRVLEGDRPRQVSVRIGLRNDRVAEVTSGLRPGTRVVLAEFDPSAAASQGFGPPGGRFGPGGGPGRGMLGVPGGPRPGGSGGGDRR